MKIPPSENYTMMAHEAFIRRAAEIEMPFMLKGSYITRQYFPPGIDRIPADLDWVYMEHLDDQQKAEAIFTHWVTLITELDLNDGVMFESFRRNRFWRMIDYAMADDFPTVDTDLTCIVNGEDVAFSLDISFNLAFSEPPVALVYKPVFGEPFNLPATVPISLQVSWKIHQTLVRPRFKDIFDLTYLLQNPLFDEQALKASLQELINECEANNVGDGKLRHFFRYEFDKLFPEDSSNDNWNYWRHNIKVDDKNKMRSIYWAGSADSITDAEQLPSELSDFLQQFANALSMAGFNESTLEKLPKPKVLNDKKNVVVSPENSSTVSKPNTPVIFKETVSALIEDIKEQPTEPKPAPNQQLPLKNNIESREPKILKLLKRLFNKG